MSTDKSLSERLADAGNELGTDLVRLSHSFRDASPEITLDVLLTRIDREDREIGEAEKRAGEMPSDRDHATMWLLATNLQRRRREVCDAARGIVEPLLKNAATLDARSLARILSAYFKDQRFLPELHLDWVHIGMGVQRAMSVVTQVPGLEASLQDEVEGLQLSYEEAVGCFASGHFAAAIAMSGRVLEQVLAIVYVEQMREQPSDKGIDALFNALRKHLQFDDAGHNLLASPELVTYLNSRRCTFVHRRARVQIPTEDQARSVIHLARDVLVKAFC